MRHVRIIVVGSGLVLGTCFVSLAPTKAAQAVGAGQAGQAETDTPRGAGTPGAAADQALGQGRAGLQGGANRAVGDNRAVAGRAPWNFGGWNRQPWFADPRVRQQLGLDNDQFDQLQNNYSRSWQGYERGLTGLQTDLSDEQRSIRQRELGQMFQNDVTSSVDQLLLDPAQRQRFGQLYLQYQGFNAFNDPAVQQGLNLTDRQREQLGRLQREWNEQMELLSQDFPRDRDGMTRFNELRQQASERIGNVLTDEQRRIWLQMLGQPFDFPPEVYFPPREGDNTSELNQRAVPNLPNSTQP